MISQILFILILASCASSKTTTAPLMSAPEILENQFINPFTGYEGWGTPDELGILFATARFPAAPGEIPAFENKRDNLLHLGEAFIEIQNGEVNWKETQDINILKGKGEDYPLSVGKVEIFGPLKDTINEISDPARLPADLDAPTEHFVEEINARLKDNPVKEIFIYVHGVDTTFDSPLLVSAEFWHYMGYRGVPIAFSWPSGQNILQYVSDTDTAEYSAVLFRVFLDFLREETDADKINIIAFSAGTKLTSQALHQIGLMDAVNGRSKAKVEMGRVIFVAGDVERELFGLYLLDGLLTPLESLTVYMSKTDNALKASSNIRKNPRLGQTWDDESGKAEYIDFINKYNIDFIDVTGLEGTTSEHGHFYFRNSSKISSDILANIGIGMSAEERGLIKSEEFAYWSFPEDSTARLQEGIWKKQNNQ